MRELYGDRLQRHIVLWAAEKRLRHCQSTGKYPTATRIDQYFLSPVQSQGR